MIDKYQHKDKNLLGKLKHANYHTKYFHGVGNIFMLICKNDNIFMLTILRK